MSWYDHRTLLALRLGPWAETGGPQRPPVAEIEAGWRAERQAAADAAFPGPRRSAGRALLARLGLRRARA